MATLNEGMRPGDLEDLVLPMLTIDEYESKLDDDAIVMGFYVSDKDAAGDLNRYIQKSPVQMLDTEVSPAPDQHGYYIVFIELLNDIRIVDNMEAILEEVSPLTATEEWQMRLRGNEEGVMPFSSKVLSHRFAELRSENVDGEPGGGHAEHPETESRVMEFFQPSDLKNVVIEGHRLVLTGHDSEFRAEIVAFGEAESLLDSYNLSESAFSLNLTDIAKSLKMTRLLGDGWMSSRLGEHSILQHVGSDSALLLRNARFV
jgi:hypothetical protein